VLKYRVGQKIRYKNSLGETVECSIAEVDCDPETRIPYLICDGMWLEESEILPPEGQKDDGSKLRMDLIPAKSLRLILEHVWGEPNDPGNQTQPATFEGCLELLAEWRDTGDIEALAFAASHALELCGGDVMSVSGFGLEEVARILAYGAFEAPRPDGSKGYGENNWQLVQDAENRYYAAALRHWARARAGEERDPVSGRKHVGHLACCLLFLLYVCG
jgi:hypothetical protein